MANRAGIVILVAFIGAAWATPVHAESRDFMISMSGFLGTTEQAEPVLNKLFRRLETTLGWPADSINGAYYPDPEDGLRQMKQLNPGFAVVTHQMYFEHRKSMKMRVIAGMELSDGAMSRFHLVTKKEGGPAKIEELAGRSIASPHLKEVLFAEKILLGGGLSLGSGSGAAKAIHLKAPLGALRRVHRGSADAALVDEPVVKQLSSLPFGNDLQVIFSSGEIPPLPVVSFGTSKAADRGPMAKALIGLCNGAEGAELCQSLRVSAIRSASDSTYAGMLEKLR